MKVSITLEFDTPAHAIVALDHINALRKGNFGETTAAPTGAKTDGEPTGGSKPAATTEAESTPKATKPRKPRAKKADKPAAEPVAEPTGDVPTLADVQAAVKGIFETKGAVAALGLLKTMNVERAAELPDDKRADFIKQAKAL